VLLVSLIGYGTGSVSSRGLLKPFHPDTAGLWVWRASGDITYSVRLASGQFRREPESCWAGRSSHRIDDRRWLVMLTNICALVCAAIPAIAGLPWS